MKTALLALIVAFCLAGPLFAADDPQLSKLKSADDERVAAITAADKGRLDAIFSDELRYAHSTGGVDTKASYMDSIVSGKLKYVVYEYQERNFTFPAPGVALMSGKAHIKSASANGTNENVLGFLAVWREEGGKWRFYAWQSCKIAPPATPAK